MGAENQNTVAGFQKDFGEVGFEGLRARGHDNMLRPDPHTEFATHHVSRGLS